MSTSETTTLVAQLRAVLELTNTEVVRFRQDRPTQDFGVNTHPAAVIVMPISISTSVKPVWLVERKDGVRIRGSR